MARSLSNSLLSAQQTTKRKPYVSVIINNVDYSNRVLFVEHHEEQYRDWATIKLNNSDRGLDNVDFTGYRFRIGYGYYTGQIVAPPNGDNEGNEYSESADLWVKTQQSVSSPGYLECVLYCEGQWFSLREQRVTVIAGAVEKGDPDDVGDASFFLAVFQTKTVYELIELVIKGAFDWTLSAAPSPDDEILTSFRPVYSLEELPYAVNVLIDLITMTKCYLRPRANLTWEIIYPQTGDTAIRTFYSDQTPYFIEYANCLNLPIPNRIVVLANNPDDNPLWPNVIVGDTGEYSGVYPEVIKFYIDENTQAITTQDDANKRAAALLSRITNTSELIGYLITPHDCSLELYDRIQIKDRRGR